jgi:hypothetical protein
MTTETYGAIMHYYQGRSARVWNSAISLHGKKAADPQAKPESDTDGTATEAKKDALSPRRATYPVVPRISFFPDWRVYQPADDQAESENR